MFLCPFCHGILIKLCSRQETSEITEEIAAEAGNCSKAGAACSVALDLLSQRNILYYRRILCIRVILWNLQAER